MIAAGGELYEQIQDHGWRARFDHASYYRRYFRWETALLRRLKWRAIFGVASDGRGTRLPRPTALRQARKIEHALTYRYPMFTEKTDEAALRGCVRVAMGIVQHLATGASLPAECSTGDDWSPQASRRPPRRGTP